MDITLPPIIKYANICIGKYVGENIDVNNNIWDYEPEPTVTNNNITIFYNKIIPTGRYIEGNAIKLGIVI